MKFNLINSGINRFSESCLRVDVENGEFGRVRHRSHDTHHVKQI
jgi:hypothetical protein